MNNPPSRNSRLRDRSAAVTLEVPAGVADAIESVLRHFAREADLDTSLVVDHSGFLVAGVSSLPEVDVDSIGSLVASASGAVDGLSGALGEAGRVESFHLGEDRLIYLREVGERFILVGVSDSNIPAGILRDQANQIEADLLKQLSRVKALPASLTRKKAADQPAPSTALPEAPKSLRPTVPPPPNVPVPTPVPTPGVVAHSQQVPLRVAVPARPAFPPASAPSQSGLAQSSQQAAPALRPAAASAQPDPVPPSIFELDDEGSETVDFNTVPDPSARSAPIESKRVTRAVVEYSPFEMDDEEEEAGFKPTRPQTTPVHISVPAARQREAEARGKRAALEEENDGGPRYSFELG